MSKRPAHLWRVLLDHPGWRRPRVVAGFDEESPAREYARRKNAARARLDSPLYFVEHWQTSDVLDTEHSAERAERGFADERR